MYGWNVNVGPVPKQSIGSMYAPNPASLSAQSETKVPASRGFFAGTLIGCKDGWRSVETLSAGDLVWTFDNGLQPLRGIQTQELRPRGDNPNLELVVYRVASGGLGNEEVLVFLPGTGLLVECENGCDVMGNPYAVIPVDALDGMCGVRRDTVPGSVTLHALVFDQEEVFYIDSGLMVHAAPHSIDTETRYDVQKVKHAQEMLTDLDLAELALREADEEFFGEVISSRVA